MNNNLGINDRESSFISPVILMEPVIGSTTCLTLEANNSPSGWSGLSKIVTHVRVSFITSDIVLRLHDNISKVFRG